MSRYGSTVRDMTQQAHRGAYRRDPIYTGPRAEANGTWGGFIGFASCIYLMCTYCASCTTAAGSTNTKRSQGMQTGHRRGRVKPEGLSSACSCD